MAAGGSESPARCGRAAAAAAPQQSPGDPRPDWLDRPTHGLLAPAPSDPWLPRQSGVLLAGTLRQSLVLLAPFLFVLLAPLLFVLLVLLAFVLFVLLLLLLFVFPLFLILE